MKNVTTSAFALVLIALSSPGKAELRPLNCKDYILLTETAVQQRDAKFSLRESLGYLGGDEFMSKRDEKIVRQMIARVFQKKHEGLSYHVKQSKIECATKIPAAG